MRLTYIKCWFSFPWLLIVDMSKLKVWKGVSFSLNIKLLKQIYIWLQWLPSMWENVKTKLRTIFLMHSTTGFLMLPNYKGIVDMLGNWYLNTFCLSKHFKYSYFFNDCFHFYFLSFCIILLLSWDKIFVIFNRTQKLCHSVKYSQTFFKLNFHVSNKKSWVINFQQWK